MCGRRGTQSLGEVTAPCTTCRVPSAGRRASLGPLMASCRDQCHIHWRQAGRRSRSSERVCDKDPGGPGGLCEHSSASSCAGVWEVMQSPWSLGGACYSCPSSGSLITLRPGSSLLLITGHPPQEGGVGLGKIKRGKPLQVLEHSRMSVHISGCGPQEETGELYGQDQTGPWGLD